MDGNTFDNLSVGSPEFNEKCSSIANDIKCGKCKILNLVENLHLLLTSSLTEQRLKGITVLSAILSGLPKTMLSTSEIGVLVNFLCDKLNDHHEVVPTVIKALLIIVNMENLPNGTAKRILSSLFERVPCQQQQQADRYNIYTIFKQLHRTKPEELEEMGLDLIYGIITAIDGERDPRNLSFLFEWLEDFLKEFELGHLAEEMFEVLACYFPVDFRPTSEEAITRDSLAHLLSKCLCASQKFGDFIIPLTLEKLDSELTTAKTDSLQVLDLVCQNFPSSLLMKYSNGIWPSLHKEILTAKDDELQSTALKTLQSFVRCVCTETNRDVLNLLESMMLNVKGNATPDSKMFGGSCKIIFATAATKISSEFAIEIAVPLWINLFNITTTTKHRVDILKVLCELTVIAAKLSDIRNFSDNKHLENVPSTFMKALAENNDDIKSESLRCLAKSAPYVSEEIRRILFENLEVLLFLPLQEDCKKLLFYCLKEYAKFYPEETTNLILSLKCKNNLKVYLEVVGSLLDIKELRCLSIREIVFYIVNSSIDDLSLPLNILRKTLENNDDLDLEMYLLCNEDFIAKLTDYYIKNSKEFEVDIHMEILQDLSIVLYRIIAKLPETEQDRILTDTIVKIKPKPIDEMFIIWYGIFVGLRSLKFMNAELLNNFINVAFNTKFFYVNDLLSRLIGNLINKLSYGEILNNALDNIENYNINFSECNHIRNALNVLTFTTKALVLRGHEKATLWTERLLQYSEKHKEACESFRVILNDSCTCFTKFCHVNERRLYKQKFFTDVLNYVHRKSVMENNENYLTVMAYVVQGIPEALLRMHFTKIIKWIILYLDISDDVTTTGNLCRILNRAVENKEEQISNYINEILKVYLKLSTRNPSMKVRMETLRGIRLFADFPIHQILKYKQDVVKTLNSCVDDRKRLVRKEAMESRLKWYLIDSPI